MKVIVPPVPASRVSDCVLGVVPLTVPASWILAPADALPLLVVSNTEVVPARVIASVDEPREIALPAVRTVPSRVTAGAVAVRPPLKSSTSAAAPPNVTVPVLANVTALVTESLVPVRETL